MNNKTIGGIVLVLSALLCSCQSDEQLEFSRYYSTGSVIYQSKCQNCHGANGEGLAALIPPLTDSVYLQANKTALACAIKYGLKGNINVAHKQFDGPMPANDLAPIEIAEVLTYVTNSFGNKMGTVTVLQADGEMKNCK